MRILASDWLINNRAVLNVLCSGYRHREMEFFLRSVQLRYVKSLVTHNFCIDEDLIYHDEHDEDFDLELELEGNDNEDIDWQNKSSSKDAENRRIMITESL